MIQALIAFFPSPNGELGKLAQMIKKGAESLKGVNVIANIYQIPSYSDSASGVAIDNAAVQPLLKDPALLEEPDVIFFGIPSTFGMVPYEIKAFLDSTGQLWRKGALNGKLVSCFFSGDVGSGQETSVMATMSYFAHHGMIFAPIGYTSQLLFDLSAPHGGSPWGAGTIVSKLSATSRNVTELELKVAEHQGKLVTEYATFFKRGKSKLNQSHKVHTTSHPAYPARSPVTAVPWSSSDEGYKPVDFTADVVIANDSTKKQNGWADPADITLIPKDTLIHRISYCGPIEYDSNGYPVNPVGRTGMKGRGLLGKWGPNHAADPIVTRIKPGTSDTIQMVAIQRADTKVWAIPGGMVDPGEKVSQTLKREFTEEAGEVAPELREKVQAQINELFEHEGVEVYRGYVDDPRNTDQSWMETVAVHFHCSEELGNQLHLGAGDDASLVKWLDVDESNPEFANLYASHKMMVLEAVKGLRHRLKTIEENKAASKLQHLFREHRSASTSKIEDLEAKKRREEEEEAAKTLQHAFREHRASIKQHDEEEEAAKTLQHAFREHRASVKQHETEENAAKTLQHAFREHKSSMKNREGGEGDDVLSPKSKSHKSAAIHGRGEFTVGNDTFKTGVKKLQGKKFNTVAEYIAFLNSA